MNLISKLLIASALLASAFALYYLFVPRTLPGVQNIAVKWDSVRSAWMFSWTLPSGVTSVDYYNVILGSASPVLVGGNDVPWQATTRPPPGPLSIGVQIVSGTETSAYIYQTVQIDYAPLVQNEGWVSTPTITSMQAKMSVHNSHTWSVSNALVHVMTYEYPYQEVMPPQKALANVVGDSITVSANVQPYFTESVYRPVPLVQFYLPDTGAYLTSSLDTNSGAQFIKLGNASDGASANSVFRYSPDDRHIHNVAGTSTADPEQNWQGVLYMSNGWSSSTSFSVTSNGTLVSDNWGGKAVRVNGHTQSLFVPIDDSQQSIGQPLGRIQVISAPSTVPLPLPTQQQTLRFELSVDVGNDYGNMTATSNYVVLRLKQ
jgi:hypothetical protein